MWPGLFCLLPTSSFTRRQSTFIASSFTSSITSLLEAAAPSVGIAPLESRGPKSSEEPSERSSARGEGVGSAGLDGRRPTTPWVSSLFACRTHCSMCNSRASFVSSSSGTDPQKLPLSASSTRRRRCLSVSDALVATPSLSRCLMHSAMRMKAARVAMATCVARSLWRATGTACTTSSRSANFSMTTSRWLTERARHRSRRCSLEITMSSPQMSPLKRIRPLRMHRPRRTMKSVRSTKISSEGAKTIVVRRRDIPMMMSLSDMCCKYHTLSIQWRCKCIEIFPCSMGDSCCRITLFSSKRLNLAVSM
mmetsp:Transcript_9180/g.25810  ORF Transcript_9180/g.25810 Transcript_9180/m.25810 type:complete len:307 (+) Transcript_9180:194-1114(+)